MAYETLSAAKAAYLANATYDIDRSAAKCAAFIEACRALLLLLPKRVRHGRAGGELETDPAVVTEQLDKATRIYQTLRTSGEAGVVRASFEDFRS